jgi:hypothetical protein
MTRTTTILGKVYQGRPKMGSAAMEIWATEDRMGFAAAERQLRAKNAIRKVWGCEPLDLQDDMTDLPLEGVQTFGRKA